jgi:hypothetical protein
MYVFLSVSGVVVHAYNHSIQEEVGGYQSDQLRQKYETLSENKVKQKGLGAWLKW